MKIGLYRRLYFSIALFRQQVRLISKDKLYIFQFRKRIKEPVNLSKIVPLSWDDDNNGKQAIIVNTAAIINEPNQAAQCNHFNDNGSNSLGFKCSDARKDFSSIT